MGKRIIATFVPQHWVNDFAYEVNIEQPKTWDITDYLLANYTDGEMLALRDDQYETDNLRDDENAPQWVKDWPGPFYVRVEQSIADYFEED